MSRKPRVHANVLVIPDLHFPYNRKSVFKDIQGILFKNPKITDIVLIGDVVDLHSVSFHPVSADLDSPATEIKKARKYIDKLITLLDGKRVHWCLGNHDLRLQRKAASVGLPSCSSIDLKTVFGIPEHWHLAHSIVLDGVTYIHNISKVRGRALTTCNTEGIVQGHFHTRLGIEFIAQGGKMRWSAFVGAAVDEESIAMAYAKGCCERPVYGFLIVESGLPRIVLPD